MKPGLTGFLKHCKPLFLIVLLFAPHALLATEENTQTTIAVVGDSLADGIWAGLYRTLRSKKEFSVLRETENSSGLTSYDWERRALRLLERKNVQVAVIMMGANDGQAMLRHGKPRLPYHSEGWAEAYQERVDTLLKVFADKGIFIIWVGLPIMRTESMREQAVLFNNIYKQAVEKQKNALFVPTWPVTVGTEGEYIAYTQFDDSDRKALFRANDGVHFTTKGYGLLAKHIFQALDKAYLHPATTTPEPAQELITNEGPSSKSLPEEVKPQQDTMANAASPKEHLIP